MTKLLEELVKENSESHAFYDSSKFHRVSNVRVFGLEGLSVFLMPATTREGISRFPDPDK